MRHFILRLWMRRSESIFTQIIFFPLLLISWAVAIVAQIRRAILPQKAFRAAVPVISIGNVSVGGTGKTPVTIEVAQRLECFGKKVAILSRGYGRSGSKKSTEPVVVSDGISILATTSEGGDEPVLMAQALPKVPILVCADRAQAAQLATEKFSPDVLLLDDGFQHFGLARELDVVLADGINPVGNGHVIPRGPLREPFRAISSAQLTWITRVHQSKPATVELLAQRLERLTGHAPIFSSMAIQDIADLRGKSMGLEAFFKKKVFLACGLGRPESFKATAVSAGAQLVGESFFDDHHDFTAQDLDDIQVAAKKAEAEFIAITAKDAAKIAPLLGIDVRNSPGMSPAQEPADSSTVDSAVSSIPTSESTPKKSSKTTEETEVFERVPFAVIHIRLKILSGEEALNEALRGVFHP